MKSRVLKIAAVITIVIAACTNTSLYGQAHFDNLQSFYAKGKYDKCIIKAKKAARQHPEDPTPSLYQMSSYLQKAKSAFTPTSYSEYVVLALESLYSAKAIQDDINQFTSFEEDIQLLQDWALSEYQLLSENEKQFKADYLKAYYDLIYLGGWALSSSNSETGQLEASAETSTIDMEVTSYDLSEVEYDDMEMDIVSLEGNELTFQLRQTSYGLMGTPYRYGGTTPESGFDCSGFTRYVFDKSNIELPRTSSAQSTQGSKVKLHKAMPGDLIFFGSKGNISHVGMIYTNEDGKISFIHSSSSRGVVIVHQDDEEWEHYWAKKLVFVKRVVS